MRRLLLALTLAASSASAQVPSDTLGTRLAQRLSAYRQYLAAHPNAKLVRRLENVLDFTNRGRHTAIFGRGLSYVDPDTRELTPTNLDLYQTEAGWRTTGSPITIRVIDGPQVLGGATTEIDTYYKDPNDGSVTGYGIAVRPITYYQGLSFRFSQQAIPWQIDLGDFGWDLQARVASSQGAKTYQFGYREVGMTLAPDADGNLSIPNGRYKITRPVMVRADRLTTPCSAWGRSASIISFTCDDTAFPAQAYPYVIDPTASFNVGTSGDDGRTRGQTSPTWPPAYSDTSTAGTSIGVVSWNSGGYYRWDVPMYRFDTSSLGTGVRITGATFNVGVFFDYSPEGKHFQAEYYASSNWPIDSEDYTTSPVSATAIDPVAITYPGTLYPSTSYTMTLTLKNPDANINKTGYTGLRFSVTESTAPSSENDIYMYTFDATSGVKPYLQVDYELATAPLLIVVNQ